MKTSIELQKECHLGDPFLSSNTLAILTRLGLISKGYGLTDLGRARLREISYTTNQSVGTSTREPSLLENGLARSMPMRPDDSIATPGFTWVFDEESWKWVMRRKQNRFPTELRREPERMELFPP